MAQKTLQVELTDGTKAEAMPLTLEQAFAFLKDGTMKHAPGNAAAFMMVQDAHEAGVRILKASLSRKHPGIADREDFGKLLDVHRAAEIIRWVLTASGLEMEGVQPGEAKRP